MSPEPVRSGLPPRVGLVLGAGGVLGAAWMTGALPAVQERLGRPLGEVGVIVGTSAGSVVAAALRCGISVDEMIAHQRGEAIGVLGSADLDEVAGRPWPLPPRMGLGSPRLILATVMRPHRMHPAVGASAWVPPGRGSHRPLRDMVHSLHCHAHGHTSPPDWVDGGQTWIVAIDYDSGRRVIFGRAGAPSATLPDAVVASCSIPGWYTPAVIGRRRYVDGGVRSSTSLGVLTRADVDEVFVLAPMASIVAGRPRQPHERLERQIRALITNGLLHDVRRLRLAGIRVTVLTPGPQDLAVMGVNLMDSRRRRLVLETSLATSADALSHTPEDEPKVA